MDYPQKVKYLVFSGGAAKGYAHLGVLNVLESVLKLYSINMTDHIEGYGGSSFGAILALACSLGLDYSVVREWFMSVDNKTMFSQFDIMNFTDTKGIIPAHVLSNKLDELLLERFGDKAVASGTITLEYLFKRTRKLLRIVVSNVSTGKYEVWDHVSHGSMCVKRAIMASAAIPCIFPPVVESGNVYLDGGLYCNFPITIFPATKVLGIQLSSNGAFNLERSGIAQYLIHVLSSSSSFYEQYYLDTLDPEYAKRTVHVNISLEMSSLDLVNPSSSTKSELVKIGEAEAMSYFIDSTIIGKVMDIFKTYTSGQGK